MKTVSVELPETVFSALRKDPKEFVREMRIAAAVQWYEMGKISQENAAEIAGLSLDEWGKVLYHYKDSPIL